MWADAAESPFGDCGGVTARPGDREAARAGDWGTPNSSRGQDARGVRPDMLIAECLCSFFEAGCNRDLSHLSLRGVRGSHAVAWLALGAPLI